MYCIQRCKDSVIQLRLQIESGMGLTKAVVYGLIRVFLNQKNNHWCVLNKIGHPYGTEKPSGY